MSSSTTFNLRPAKRRKIKKNDPLREDDVAAADTFTVDRITVETKAGPIEQKRLVPISATTSAMNAEIPEIQVENDDGYYRPDYGPSDTLGEEMAVPAVPETSRKAGIIFLE